MNYQLITSQLQPEESFLFLVFAVCIIADVPFAPNPMTLTILYTCAKDRGEEEKLSCVC